MPQRGAHFAYLRGHEHHLGWAKWSSRPSVVHILKNELSPARCAHFHAFVSQTNAFGVPPEPGMPAADVPPRPRVRRVLIFEENIKYLFSQQKSRPLYTYHYVRLGVVKLFIFSNLFPQQRMR